MSNRVLFITVFVLGLLVVIPLTRYLTEYLSRPPALAQWTLPNDQVLTITAELSPGGEMAGLLYTLDAPDAPPRTSRRHDRYYFASVIPYGDPATFELHLDEEHQIGIVVQDARPAHALILINLETGEHWPGFSFDPQGEIRDPTDAIEAGQPLLAKAQQAMPGLSAELIAPQDRFLLQTHDGEIIQTDLQGVRLEPNDADEPDAANAH